MNQNEPEDLAWEAAVGLFMGFCALMVLGSWGVYNVVVRFL